MKLFSVKKKNPTFYAPPPFNIVQECEKSGRLFSEVAVIVPFTICVKFVQAVECFSHCSNLAFFSVVKFGVFFSGYSVA